MSIFTALSTGLNGTADALESANKQAQQNEIFQRQMALQKQQAINSLAQNAAFQGDYSRAYDLGQQANDAFNQAYGTHLVGPQLVGTYGQKPDPSGIYDIKTQKPVMVTDQNSYDPSKPDFSNPQNQQAIRENIGYVPPVDIRTLNPGQMEYYTRRNPDGTVTSMPVMRDPNNPVAGRTGGWLVDGANGYQTVDGPVDQTKQALTAADIQLKIAQANQLPSSGIDPATAARIGSEVDKSVMTRYPRTITEQMNGQPDANLEQLREQARQQLLSQYLGSMRQPTQPSPPTAAPGGGGGLNQWMPLLQKAAQASSAPVDVLRSILSVENGAGNPKAVNVNKNGTRDVGLMQLNSNTWPSLGVTDPTDPSQNINAATRFFAGLVKQYGGDVSKAVEAYNAGHPGTPEGAAYLQRVNQAHMKLYGSPLPGMQGTQSVPTPVAGPTPGPNSQLPPGYAAQVLAKRHGGR